MGGGDIENMITVINNTASQPLRRIHSVYTAHYEPEVENLAKIIDTFCKTFNVKFVFKNAFGVKQIFDKTCSSKHLFSYNFPHDCYPELVFLKNLKQKFDVVVDVGANRCNMASVLSTISHRIYAFEPCKQTFYDGKETLQLNNISNVELYNMAVSDGNGEVEFFDYGFERHGHNSLLRHSPECIKGSYIVKSIMLDTFLSDKNIKHIDLLKIDVEGFERQVLKGCKRYLRNKHIDIITFEISKTYIDDKGVEELFDLFINNGYKIFDFDVKEICLSDLNDIYHIDLIAILDDKVEYYKNAIKGD